MDDYNIASLSESKNEWCARLVNAMTPAVIEGLRSIFKEATELCAREEQEEISGTQGVMGEELSRIRAEARQESDDLKRKIDGLKAEVDTLQRANQARKLPQPQPLLMTQFPCQP